MKKILQPLSLALVLAGIAGCQSNLPPDRSQQVETPAATVIGTATRFPFHTVTPNPTPTHTSTPEPASTPESPEVTGAPTVLLDTHGPWLAYLRYGISIVNQDGTGRTILDNLECDGVGIQENPLNRLVVFPRAVYLVQPEATWMLIYREWPCYTDFTGDEKGGLLATIHHSTTNGMPELRIYELPSGKIRDQFPLVKCSTQSNSCNFPDSTGPNFKWSSNGRYLAFSAIWNGPSSDLYVYDTVDGKTRQLTSGPDHVGSIWWSPDGSQIVMGEILFENTDSGANPSSLWAVSVSDNEIRLLYSLDDPYPQGLIGWLDASRFIVYDGTNLINALDLPAKNIRLVDMRSGEITTMFSGSFVAAALDQAHETLAFYAYDPDPRPGYGGPGVYLVSTMNPMIRYMEGASQVVRDDETGLFVTVDPCEDEPKGRKAFNYNGEWKCIHHKLPPESFSSPDGKWQVLLQDGFWLNSEGKQAVRVSEETPTQIIWRPDSAGFFFLLNQTLYYSSLPELDIIIVDDYPGSDSIVSQWVSGN